LFITSLWQSLASQRETRQSKEKHAQSQQALQSRCAALEKVDSFLEVFKIAVWGKQCDDWFRAALLPAVDGRAGDANPPRSIRLTQKEDSISQPVVIGVLFAFGSDQNEVSTFDLMICGM
jgi:hypothetical protein